MIGWIIVALWCGPAIAWMMWKDRSFGPAAILTGILMAGLAGPLTLLLIE